MHDYKKIGLKSGIEIHQQIDTNKLFCNCPSILRAEEPDIIVKRKLHAVAGESGKIDVAAAYEHSREREFLYQAYTDSTCLVELDEEPPHLINNEALRTALQVALLLNAKPLEISQVMRKTVIDGSNTSGFQRTMLIARDGWIQTSLGKVGIESVCLEEDAARIISQDSKEVIYRLDRLGIPLVEIATKPDIVSPEQAKEAALHIGEILRACKVKRGIGTIRQDVNLSISGGKRIEIKGVQEPSLISKTIEKEIDRQLVLVKENKSEEEVRKANPDGSTAFLRPLPGRARMYPETDIPLLKIDRNLIREIKQSLPKMKHELKQELSEKGLSQELTKLVLQENKLEEYKELIEIYDNPNLVAKILVLFPKDIASHEKLSPQEVEDKLTIDIIGEVLENIKAGRIMEEKVKSILEGIVKGKSLQDSFKQDSLSSSDIEKEVQELLKSKPDLSLNAYMGILMGKLKGRASGKDITDILKKYVK